MFVHPIFCELKVGHLANVVPKIVVRDNLHEASAFGSIHGFSDNELIHIFASWSHRQTLQVLGLLRVLGLPLFHEGLESQGSASAASAT